MNWRTIKRVRQCIESAGYFVVEVNEDHFKCTHLDDATETFYYVYPNDVIYFDFSKRRFWAIDSYSGFLSVISSSLSMLVSVWNAFN